jgi:hypothetical protein
MNIVIDTVFPSNEHQNQSKTIIFDRNRMGDIDTALVSGGSVTTRIRRRAAGRASLRWDARANNRNAEICTRGRARA